MEKIKLIFKSPQLLNELKETKELKSEQWTYIDERKTVLELDIQNWIIFAGNISAKINQWMVNEDNMVMKLRTDKSEIDFQELDYPFAVSMISQITDKNTLQKYLSDLLTIYTIEKKEEDSKKPEKESEHKDIEKEKKDNLPSNDNSEN